MGLCLLGVCLLASLVFAAPDAGLTLLSLLLGSIPGIWIGSYLSSKINENKLRYILVLVLLGVGTELLIN